MGEGDGAGARFGHADGLGRFAFRGGRRSPARHRDHGDGSAGAPRSRGQKAGEQIKRSWSLAAPSCRPCRKGWGYQRGRRVLPLGWHGMGSGAGRPIAVPHAVGISAAAGTRALAAGPSQGSPSPSLPGCPRGLSVSPQPPPSPGWDQRRRAIAIQHRGHPFPSCAAGRKCAAAKTAPGAAEGTRGLHSTRSMPGAATGAQKMAHPPVGLAVLLPAPAGTCPQPQSVEKPRP